jgi:hypothetical protein
VLITPSPSDRLTTQRAAGAGPDTAIRGDAEKAIDHAEPIEAATTALAKAHPELLIEGFGDATSGKAFDDTLAQDFQKAEFLSTPITLVILVGQERAEDRRGHPRAARPHVRVLGHRPDRDLESARREATEGARA